MEECGFRRTKAVISLIRGKIGPELPSLPLRTNTKSYTRFCLCQHQRPWMTWKGYYAPRLHSRRSLRLLIYCNRLLYFDVMF